MAEGACYHHICWLSFFKGCHQPAQDSADAMDNLTAFEKACLWLEQDIESHSVSEFSKKI